MRLTNSKMCSTAIAALLSLPLATGAAWAQQSQATDQTQQANQQSEDTAQQQSSQSATGSEQTAGDQQQQQDTVVATVGEVEIRGSDVMTVIGMLPPQLQSQPPQMLVPIALDQLILRELILEEARGQDLANDPEVVALVESSAQTAEADAIVQVWLDRELTKAVTDEAVQQTYADVQAQGQEDLPPIEELRPQIEQHLRQQAVRDIQARLREGADIVLYDPAGRPVEQQQEGETEQSQSSQDDGGGTAGNTSSEGASNGQETESAEGSSETSGEQTQSN